MNTCLTLPVTIATVIILIGCLLLSGCTAVKMSPGRAAIQSNDVAGMRKLLDAGLSPDHYETGTPAFYQDTTLLGAAILFMGNNERIELLVERGATPSKAAWGVFVYANRLSEERARQAIGTLLDKGVDPNIRIGAKTPLHMSCLTKGGPQLLLSRGARVDEVWRQPNGPSAHTALGVCLGDITRAQKVIASRSTDSSRTIIDLFTKQIDLAEENALVLIKGGAVPLQSNQEQGEFIPVLLKAYQLNQPRIVQALIKASRGGLDHRYPGGGTTLHIVAGQGDAAGARELIANARAAADSEAESPAQADDRFYRWLNQADNSGRTALHTAAMQGADYVIEPLLEAGADHRITDRAGQTAQQYLDKKIAADEKSREMASEAQQRGFERAERDRRTAEVNRQGILAVAGAAVIGKATSGKNFTHEQRSALTDAYVSDRINAANGVKTNNFGTAADATKRRLDMASAAAAAQARISREVRTGDNRQANNHSMGNRPAAPPRLTASSTSQGLVAAPAQTTASSGPSFAYQEPDNTTRDDSDRANIALMKSTWGGAKKIVQRSEPCGSGKTQEEARSNSEIWWDRFKQGIEYSHERGLAYGRILSKGATTCGTTAWPVGDSSHWGCSVAYTKEVLDRGESGPAKGVSR